MMFATAAAAAFGSAFSGLLAASGGTDWSLFAEHVLAVVVYAAIGMAVFGVGILLFVKLAPFSVRKEIEEDQNTALGIIMGAVLLGLSIIIAAAVHG